jgi:broad specificity phosphatase PhoE
VAEEPVTDPEADAIAAALAEAVADVPAEDPATETADSGAQDLPQGPPISASDIEGIRSALGKCWNIGALSSEATRTIVTVRVSMQENGTPDLGTMNMTSFEGGSEESAKKLYQSARSAIARCGNKGFTLPPEKYDQWKDLELVFDPNGMRLR